MDSKIFSYKVDGIALAPVNDQLSTSPVFNRKELLDKLKDLFADDDFKIDERSISYKVKDDQLFVEGMIVKKEEPKTIGFTMGR